MHTPSQAPATSPSADAALSAPAVARNRGPILAVLRRVLPAAGTVLEVASGTGEHAVFCAAALPQLSWQPSDCDRTALASIAARREAAALPNLLAPVALDVAREPWPIGRADAVVAINLIHIAPWAAAEGLIAGAARRLPPGGPLVLYGAYKEGGRHTAPSNAAFDADLRASDPAWGVRDRADVEALAARHGFIAAERIEMPAHNLALVFRRG